MFGDKLQRHRRSFEAGETLFEEGDWGNAIFIIDEGSVEVIKENESQEMFVSEIGSGEIVGELVLGTSDSIRTATVRALTNVQGWKIRAEKVEKLLSQSSSFREQFIKTIAKRLHKTNQELAQKNKIERKLFETAFLFLSVIDEEDWMNGDGKIKDYVMNKEPEFLAYKFDTSLEKMEDFLVSPTIEDVNNLDDPKLKQDFINIAMRIVDRARSKIDIKVPFMSLKNDSMGECVGNEALLRGIRKASRRLNQLEENSARMEHSDYQEIKSDIEELELIYDDLDPNRKNDSFTADHFRSMIDDIKEKLSNIRLKKDS